MQVERGSLDEFYLDVTGARRARTCAHRQPSAHGVEAARRLGRPAALLGVCPRRHSGQPRLRRKLRSPTVAQPESDGPSSTPNLPLKFIGHVYDAEESSPTHYPPPAEGAAEAVAGEPPDPLSLSSDRHWRLMLGSQIAHRVRREMLGKVR